MWASLGPFFSHHAIQSLRLWAHLGGWAFRFCAAGLLPQCFPACLLVNGRARVCGAHTRGWDGCLGNTARQFSKVPGPMCTPREGRRISVAHSNLPTLDVFRIFHFHQSGGQAMVASSSFNLHFTFSYIFGHLNMLFVKFPFKYFAHFSFRFSASLIDF